MSNTSKVASERRDIVSVKLEPDALDWVEATRERLQAEAPSGFTVTMSHTLRHIINEATSVPTLAKPREPAHVGD